MTKSSIQKLGQGRAVFAYEQAKDGWQRHRKEFPQTVKGVPMLIKKNGLAAALAFMYSKQNTLGTVLKAISAWLSHDGNIHTAQILHNVEGSNLMQKIQNLNSLHYRKLTIETMVFLQLLRRYAEGINKTEQDKSKKEEDMVKRQETEKSRASFAYKQALKGCNDGDKDGKEFSQLTRKIPMMVKTNGLSETLAFMYSKQGKHGVILNSIEEWLMHHDNKIHLVLQNTIGENLVQKITELDTSAYRTVTIETMGYLQWLSRFSEGIIKEAESKSQNTDV